MRVKKVIISCIALLLTFNGIAQDLPEQLKSWLSSSELSKIKKANIRIDQGEQILFSQQLRELSDSVPEEKKDYLTLSNNMFINKKTSRLLLETKEYFASGFDSKLEIYKTYLDHFLRADSTNIYPKAQALNDSIDIYLSDAQLFRDRSEIKGNLIAAANSINQSNKNLQSAIILCEKALVLIKDGETPKASDTTNEDLTETKELVIQQIPEKKEEPSVVPVQKTEIKEEPVTIAKIEKSSTSNVNSDNVTSNSSSITESKEEPAKKVMDKVYFTVQILADKKPVSNERLKAVYKGSLPIIENQGDGWYRYSFGKFNDYSSAKKALLNSNIKGYVVAYKDKTRISVREAITYLQQINQ